MAEQPFPLQKPNDMPLESYLLNILAAIVKNNGGEIRLTAASIIAAAGTALTRYPTEKKDGIVLRVTTEGTDTYFVKEAPSWTTQPTPPRTRAVQPQNPVATTQAPPPINNPRNKVLTDMSMYLAEQERYEHLKDLAESQNESDLRGTGVYPWTTKQ